MFQFLFSADIWGTVSDWVMIVVTLATAIALFLTLKSQKEVQQAQNKLLQIEQLRLRENFKPTLKYCRYDDGNVLKSIDKTLMVGKNLISIAVSNNSDNDALNINPIFYNSKDVTPLYIPTFKNLLKGEKYLCFHFVANFFKGDIFSYNFRFSLTFEDISGTKYKQDILCYKSDEWEEVKSFMPEIIN